MHNSRRDAPQWFFSCPCAHKKWNLKWFCFSCFVPIHNIVSFSHLTCDRKHSSTLFCQHHLQPFCDFCSCSSATVYSRTKIRDSVQLVNKCKNTHTHTRLQLHCTEAGGLKIQDEWKMAETYIFQSNQTKSNYNYRIIIIWMVVKRKLFVTNYKHMEFRVRFTRQHCCRYRV